MMTATLLCGSVGIPTTAIFLPNSSKSYRPLRLPIQSCHRQLLLTTGSSRSSPKSSSVVSDSLRLLEWDKVCECVASFAGTQLGREAAKERLWSPGFSSYEESKRLLVETAAVVEMINCGIGGLDFSRIDVVSVKLAVERALRGFPLNGREALAVACIIQSAETLQVNLKVAFKEDSERYNSFMPLTEMIMQLIICHPLVNIIHQVIDEDMSIKDSASSELKRAREQVRSLEKKLYQLLDKFTRSDANDASYSEIIVVNGRWCVKVLAEKSTDVGGLLMFSGAGSESFVEPLFAVTLNDELQQARSLVSKAEEHVLSDLTDKVLTKIDEIKLLLNAVIELDVIIARAKYSLAHGGTFPDIYLSSNMDGLHIIEEHYSDNQTIDSSLSSSLTQRDQNKWKIYVRKAYHPLLIHRHQEKLQRAKKKVTAAISEIRRTRSNSKGITSNDSAKAHLASLERRVAKLEEEYPIPVDFLISSKTSVLVITGPNTGGKTISLKTIGLASLMAKSGLYVLASEPVRLPWFDAILADIGDEQSLSQSLSTFSGHLMQISVRFENPFEAILSKSTCRSLVLLDEVGAGTNPLEGAALGMSLLESLAENSALLTVATTHHGELKALKYRNGLFENASVEFDEVNLKPTYKVLWGVPGRSNAINIAERLGLLKDIVDDARKLYGIHGAEIDKVILDMEIFKQAFQKDIQEAQDYLMTSKEHNESLLASKHRITKHNSILRARKMQSILDMAAVSRSLLHSILRQSRGLQAAKNDEEKINKPSVKHYNSEPSVGIESDSAPSIMKESPNEKHVKILKVGDTVNVLSLGKRATVLKVEISKGEILVQANNMRMKLKLTDVELKQIDKDDDSPCTADVRDVALTQGALIYLIRAVRDLKMEITEKKSIRQSPSKALLNHSSPCQHEGCVPDYHQTLA